MRKIIVTGIVILSSLSTVQAASVDISGTIGLEQLSGESVYDIGGYTCVITSAIDPVGCGITNSPLSRLEFPLNQTMINLTAEFSSGVYLAYVNLKMDISSQDGTLLDSDWTFNDPNIRTIYSESTSTSEAFILSSGFERKIATRLPTMDAFFGTELTYQNFYFEARDTRQVSIDPRACTCNISGVTITYDVTYLIPKLYFGFIIPKNKSFSTSFKLSYAPIVAVHDEDQHVARANNSDSIKISKGDLTGDALEFEFKLNFHITTFSTLQFTYRSLDISTQGTQVQNQIVNGNLETYTIQEEVRSKQRSVGIALNYAF